MIATYKNIGRIFIHSALCGLAVSSGSTYAADANPTDSNPAGLQEIVVTARKREENLQDVPVAVTALSADALESRSVASIKDLDLKVPNLSVGTYFSSSSITFGIRGLGQTDGLNTYDPAVGLYVDGVYMARTIGNMLDFLDIAQVEVLRGPQGVLYGKDTIGGAINVTTVKPGPNFGGFAEVTAGSRAHFDGMGTINLPLTDTLFAKLTAADMTQRGYGQLTLYPGEEAGNHNVKAAQFQLRYLNGPIDVIFSADGSRQRQNGPPTSLVAFVPTATTSAFNAVTGADISSKYVCPNARNCSYENLSPPDNVDVTGYSLNATYDFGAYQVKSITAYRHSNYTGGLDIDQTPFPELEFPYLNQKETQISEELQVNGSSFEDKLKWIAGLFYADEHSTYFYDATILGGDFFQLTGVDASVQQLSDQYEYTYAVFGHGSYEVTDKLSVSFGGRFTDIKKDYTGALSNIPDGVVVFPRESATKSWPFFNPQLGIEYRWTPDLQTYVTVTRGDRSGGFNGRAQSADVALRPFDPEKVTQYEIGQKSEWFDHRLRVNAAAFYSDYSDIQLTAFTIATSNSATFDTVVANAAKAKIYGGELEINAQITPELLADVSGGYTRNAFTNIDASALAAGVTPGSTLPRAPEWTAAVGLQYQIPLANGLSMTPRVDYGFTSSYDFFAQNSPLSRQGDYGITNGRLTLAPAGRTWELAVFGKNVFNREYRLWGQSLTSSLGEAIAIEGPPREWGITAKYHF